MPISGDTLHYVIQGFFSSAVVLIRYFWWLILLVFVIRGLEGVLRWFGFGKKPRRRSGASGTAGKR